MSLISDMWFILRTSVLDNLRTSVLGNRQYDAAKPSRYRPPGVTQPSKRSGDGIMALTGLQLAYQAREAYRNNDLAKGLIDDLIVRIVGRGIQVEPAIKTRSGERHPVNDVIKKYLNQLHQQVDVTGELSESEAQRKACLAWLRDGEMFEQQLIGDGRGLVFPCDVPYACEQIETDQFPFEYTRPEQGITHAIQRNGWGKPTGYWAYRYHPGDIYAHGINSFTDLKFIPANNMVHLKSWDRFKQARGVTLLHAVLVRLQNLQDYEENEEIAARLAAAQGLVIERDVNMTGFNPDDLGLDDDRLDELEIAPAAIWTGLLPGERVSSPSLNRPNPNLGEYRAAMLKAAAAGASGSYFAIANDYPGSYSSLRVWMTDIYQRIDVFQDRFIKGYVAKRYRNKIIAMLMAGVISQRDIDIRTLFEAEYYVAPRPQVDPTKQAAADEKKLKMNATTVSQLIRESGRNPEEVFAERAHEIELMKKMGISPNG